MAPFELHYPPGDLASALVEGSGEVEVEVHGAGKGVTDQAPTSALVTTNPSDPRNLIPPIPAPE